MNFPLMKNNILKSDLDLVIKHLKKKDPILTNGPEVRKFEKLWSNWLGVKYSVFVNSGSSANFISLHILKSFFPKGGEVIVSPLNWVSDIVSILNAGFTPKFVDINLSTLSLDNKNVLKNINKNTKAILMSHIQGFNGFTNDLLKSIKKNKIFLIEDVCESHGAKFNKSKLGSIGDISNFSFYYAHHLSTIEGGMICTNDKDKYELARMFRSHGMLREVDSKKYKKKIISKYPKLNQEFIFVTPGFNMRNNELGAIIGQNQMKRINERLDVQVLESSAINPELLDNIGAKDADMIIAVTNSDETNIVSCQLAESFYKVPKKIARIRSPQLTNYIERLKDELSYIDVIINPAQLVTKRLIRKIEHPSTFIVLDFISESLQVCCIKMHYTYNNIGKSIEEIEALLGDIPHRLICIIRNDNIMEIEPDINIKAHDEIYFCCEKVMINNICNIIIGKTITFKRIMTKVNKI